MCCSAAITNVSISLQSVDVKQHSVCILDLNYSLRISCQYAYITSPSLRVVEKSLTQTQVLDSTINNTNNNLEMKNRIKTKIGKPQGYARQKPNTQQIDKINTTNSQRREPVANTAKAENIAEGEDDPENPKAT